VTPIELMVVDEIRVGSLGGTRGHEAIEVESLRSLRLNLDRQRSHDVSLRQVIGRGRSRLASR